MLQNAQFLEQARSFYQPTAYTAVRPVANANVPAPGPMIQYLVPQPQAQPCLTTSRDSGWTHEMQEFSQE